MQGYLAAYIKGEYKQLSVNNQTIRSQLDTNEQDIEHSTIHSAAASAAMNSQDIHIDKEVRSHAIPTSC
ncbi:MAG: Uncharacterised protein [Prochlorococcus marinus str. MIT 9215]|nr:MAG: Uncharacterised protein [Prochlorococcus marinus str. MIT 9215]